jgi:hypothetical protein
MKVNICVMNTILSVLRVPDSAIILLMPSCSCIHFYSLSFSSRDNWGHLGGAIGGAAMSYYFGPRLYLAELPGGVKVIVDKPIIRLPASIESIPEKVNNRVTRLVRRMQIWRYTADLPDKPWRRRQRDYRRRQDMTPNKSIKPKIED